MFSRKSISGLLTGASLAALAATTGRAAAGTTQAFNQPVVNWVNDVDWLNIETGSDVGTFTNSATISDGYDNPDALNPPAAIGVHVRDGATIDSFVNDGSIQAIESAIPVIGNASTSFATATGLLIDGNAPSVTNNSSIGAFAYGFDLESGEADAAGDAAGVVFEFDDPTDPTTANFTNNGSVDVTGTGIATSLDADAEAYADGFGVVVEFDDRDAAVSSLVTNNDAFDVDFTAEANAETGAYARAEGDGILQDFDNVESGSATAINDGSIDVTGNATATSNVYYASADVNADGIDQEIDAAEVDGLQAIVAATNSETMTVSGTATASVTYGVVAASGEVAGIEQDAENGMTLSSAEATNLADISVSAVADANVTVGTYAAANVEAAGIVQYVDGANDGMGATASAMADNQGSILVSAVATASGTYVGNDSTIGGIAVAFGAGIDQGVYDAESLMATATNSADIDVLASASSNFAVGTYTAAIAVGEGVSQDLDDGITAVASFVNTGSLAVTASATNTFDYFGIGAATAIAGGVGQTIEDVESGSLTFENAAGASVSVLGKATSNAFFGQADATAVGASQSIDAFGEDSSADLSATNFGTMTVSSLATANSTYLASAEASGIGIAQDGEASIAMLDATNSGDLAVSASAMATTVDGDVPAPGIAVAEATYVGGIAQDAGGGTSAVASATNSASISAMAAAEAAAATYAAASSNGFGVMQYASAVDASAIFNNTGTLSVANSADSQSDRVALAFSRGVGVSQSARGDAEGDDLSTAVAETINDDTIIAGVTATAGGLTTADATYAFAGADAVGLDQEAYNADTARTQLTNNGTVAATASATATGDVAVAWAEATGMVAEVGDSESGTMVLSNAKTGGIWAIAEAEANGGSSAGAVAEATGAEFYGYNMELAELDAVNKGLIAASALATASAETEEFGASAYAMGVSISNFDGGLGGTFKNGNSGMVLANAIAAGPNSFAGAVGIQADAYDNGIYILNNGLIAAYAEGAEAQATGIAIGGSMNSMITAPAPPTAVATIENHGDIWAGISTDGGDTVLRGNAINTQYSGNAVTILLENDSPANIFGNIQISDDDEIFVQNGTTNFDGVINPDMMLEGSLTIRSKGTLVMLNENDEEGASRAFVDTFTMGKKGKLQLNLTPDNSSGAYPTIAGNTANLGGKLRANYAGTFYGNSIVYENVIDANTRNGKFKKVVDNSVLLDTKAVYDNAENVDLKVKRVGFGDVPGLTENQTAAGDGIEKVYDDLPNKGPFANIVKDLFTLNEAQYAAAMDQLAGAEYAQLMQSVLRSTGQLNASITDRMDCSVDPNVLTQGADAKKGCFDPNKMQVWARVGGTWNESDGDIEAPGYSENQTSIYIGGDYAINTNVFVGMAAGYLNSSMDFDDWGGRNGASMGYDGGQIALYGGYDDGVWYGRNILSYGFYSGDSRREFGITSSPQSLTGEYNTNVLSYYGEAGRRFDVMENVAATPFLGLGIAGAGIDSFTEKDPHNTGAALTIRGTDSNSVASTLGFRVNGYWGGFRPEVTLAWQHEFADARQTVDMSYDGAPKGGNFSVVSSDPGADALIVGVGASYAVGASSLISMRYDGSFWSGYNSQELSARWTTKF